MEWKDTTSYGKYRQHKDPKTWKIASGMLSITITKGHIYHPNDWVLHCQLLGMKEVTVCKNDVEKEDAQRKALEIVRQRLQSIEGWFNDIMA